MAHIAIRQQAPAAEKSAATPSTAPEAVAKAAANQAAPSDQKTVTIIDGSSGARHDVVVGGNAPDKVEADAPPAMMAGVDQRLLEKSRYGMIPVIADGLKPFTAYAAEADRVKAAKMPKGLHRRRRPRRRRARDRRRHRKLPAAVTPAFSPCSSDPGKLAERARAQRHEICCSSMGR